MSFTLSIHDAKLNDTVNVDASLYINLYSYVVTFKYNI
jgi:hypothetical protein